MRDIIKIVFLFLGGFCLAYSIGFKHGRKNFNHLLKIHESTVKECGEAWLSTPISIELTEKIN